MKINDTLKALRLASGLTQKQLADNLNLAQTTIASYENTGREPHLFALVAYADFFKCSLDCLVGREEEPADKTLVAISPEEIKLLKTYRNLNGDLKKLCLDYAMILENSDINK